MSVRSTAGAVPVRNEKGELTMRKVKVNRYVAGKVPEFARNHRDSDSSSEDEAETQPPTAQRQGRPGASRAEAAASAASSSSAGGRRRAIAEPEIVRSSFTRTEEEDEATKARRQAAAVLAAVSKDKAADSGAGSGSGSESSDDDDSDDEEVERRRERMRQLARQRLREQEEQEAGAGAAPELPDPSRYQAAPKAHGSDEGSSSGESGSSGSEDESESESEEEDDLPVLKPVFVRKSDRKTLKDENELQRKEEERLEKQRQREQARIEETKKLVEQAVKQELAAEEGVGAEVLTDDEEDQDLQLELWKVRELKRLKRDRDEREKIERERLELERIREMTEEEREAWAAANPKEVTNAPAKGKMKFMQKYYHRGAFFMDQDEELYKRDVTAPTLEDHFDKSVLPKVMQVKNFGKMSRTKYTHLKDQDTTQKDSPWASTDSALNKRFERKLGGLKDADNLDRPSAKRQRR